MDALLSIKETLEYEIKYSFFTVGWITVEIVSDSTFRGKHTRWLQTRIRSNSKIPLVGTEMDHFNTLFSVDSAGIPYTDFFWKDNLDEGLEKEIYYDFDHQLGEVRYKEEDDTRDTLDIVPHATAGQLSLYISRLYAGSDSTYRMPVYVSKKLGYVIGENTTKKERRKYKPFGKVDTYISYGDTEDIEGPFGFSGKFRAWFLDDELRVPLEARMRVFLGNVIVRIIDYKREPLTIDS